MAPANVWVIVFSAVTSRHALTKRIKDTRPLGAIHNTGIKQAGVHAHAWSVNWLWRIRWTPSWCAMTLLQRRISLCVHRPHVMSFQVLFLFTSSSWHHPLAETGRHPAPELEVTAGRLQNCGKNGKRRHGRATGPAGGQTKRKNPKPLSPPYHSLQ